MHVYQNESAWLSQMDQYLHMGVSGPEITDFDSYIRSKRERLGFYAEIYRLFSGQCVKKRYYEYFKGVHKLM